MLVPSGKKPKYPRNLRRGQVRVGYGRTSNPQEVSVAYALQEKGYSILRTGWPDFVAVKGDAVRFIEVKPARDKHLSPAQKEMARLLSRFGITVEVMSPEDFGKKPLVLTNRVISTLAKDERAALFVE